MEVDTEATTYKQRRESSNQMPQRKAQNPEDKE